MMVQGPTLRAAAVAVAQLITHRQAPRILQLLSIVCPWHQPNATVWASIESSSVNLLLGHVVPSMHDPRGPGRASHAKVLIHVA